MTELQGLQLRHHDFAARDTEILAVVVDPVERNAEVVKTLGLDFRILADPELRAIDAYDLRHAKADPEDRLMARPAAFLIDKNGVVRWRDLTANFRLRPAPETILAEVDKLG